MIDTSGVELISLKPEEFERLQKQQEVYPGELIIPKKEVTLEGVEVVTQASITPSLEFVHPGFTRSNFGLGWTYVDVIHVNKTEAIQTGTIGTPTPLTPRWEDKLFVGFPANGLTQHESIYRRFGTETLTGAGKLDPGVSKFDF